MLHSSGCSNAGLTSTAMSPLESLIALEVFDRSDEDCPGRELQVQESASRLERSQHPRAPAQFKMSVATRFFISEAVHPQTIDCLKTRAHYFGMARHLHNVPGE